MQTNANDFQWTKKKLDVAKLMAEGIMTQKAIADDVGIAESTLCRWKQHPEFMEKVNELTLKHELATEAGLLRECYKGLEIKRKYIEEDKNTHLHYVQEIADIKGRKKKKVEHSGSVEHTGGVVVYIPDNGRDGEDES